jgi:hypothetical protein
MKGMQAHERRKHLRWLSLVQLDAGRPGKMNERALLPLLCSVYPDLGSQELRRELDYLALRGLLTITEKSEGWRLKLTYQGVDIVEYTSQCPPGVGRPIAPAG